MSAVGRAAALLAGLAAGTVSAVLELPAVVLLAAVPPARPAARRLVAVERRRLSGWLRSPVPEPDGDLRALAYLAARVPVGLLGGAVLFLLCCGLVAGAAILAGWLTGHPLEDAPARAPIIGYVIAAGLVLLFLAVQGLLGVAALERRLALRVLGGGGAAVMRRRIAELAISRADVVTAVDEERRRIERDLHDGVQQHLVALGMLVGRARRASDPARTADLLAIAHAESQRALTELREVAWRIYPAALADDGLPAALETVAERASIPVDMAYRLDAAPPVAVATAIYFVVCETVTNAAKHSGAQRVRVAVTGSAGRISVQVRDDGSGGAEPAGVGLSGLARRVAALDGQFTVDSPAGGPTIVTAELPCG